MSVAAIAVPQPAVAQESTPAGQQQKNTLDRQQREIQQLPTMTDLLNNAVRGAAAGGGMGPTGLIYGAVAGALGTFSYITDPLVNAVHWILTQLVSLTAALMEFIIDLAGKLLNVVLRVDTYADAPIVKEGWKFVRDLLNFLFVPALLALAFSTIAGIESYEMRRWLPRIIVAALFVNFSLGIGGGINAVATAAMNLLGGGQNGNLGQTLVTNLRKAAQTEVLHRENPKVLAEEAGRSVRTPQSGSQPSSKKAATSLEPWKLLVAQIAQLIILTVAAIVFFLLFLLFLIRVVALYILLILSPIGFAFSILPQLAPLAQRWWRTFLQWVIFGPAALTLVVLATRLAGQDSSSGTLTSVAASGQLGAIANVAFHTFLVCLFLLAALFIGREMGIAGASAIAGWGAAAAKGSAYWLSGAGVGALAGRALWTRTGAPLLAARKKEQEDIAKERARTGLAAGLGRFTAAPLARTKAALGYPSTRMQAVQRRQEDEEVKDLAARGVSFGEVKSKLNRPAYARYALDKGLITEQGDFEQALGAVRVGSTEFNKGAAEYQKRYVVAGTNFVEKKRNPTKTVTAADYEKTLQGLSDTDAYNAYTRETQLRGEIDAERVRASRNLARGVLNAGDVTAGIAIAHAARPGTAKENPAVVKELKDRGIVP